MAFKKLTKQKAYRQQVAILKFIWASQLFLLKLLLVIAKLALL